MNGISQAYVNTALINAGQEYNESTKPMRSILMPMHAPELHPRHIDSTTTYARTQPPGLSTRLACLP